ncbi:MAG: NAD(P)-dependent oxidoreductase [Microcoleus sp. PH2017_40_RAT_O_B]|jgi:nucleoside-diphosphate-sugar epimerase|uniref:NAD-dependent epimerase/dehydratase family protein n=1 Tax=unclassified Microcoleus TaxID=2642155 RepID=UPI001DC48D3E|nr:MULTISPECIES: NAD(P)-dependent oxidoreductase [unclassified Microcoleus]MCC3571003.1 NAD(P)-dependent oxidoreductase [Microcoleus sp. PH2017_34_RAT_O_A]MCC3608618.1 NAD(P)-dependent oxidoreductase [Microcoleus sp. PH2017_40_RAT_O_B]
MTINVLVTGGAGYLGSVLCEHLLDAGYHVTVIDSLMYGQNSLFHLCANPAFDFIEGDVRNEDLMHRLIKDADVIIPLAAIVGAPACKRDPWLTTSVNLEAVQLINRLRNPQQLVIYPNTNSGYGASTGDTYCTEDTPLEPISLYGQTKVQAELELLESPNAITLRLATVFGTSPRMRLDLLVNHFVYTAITDGYLVIFEKDFKRNYVHIRDVADCMIYCIKNSPQMVGRPYNVGLDEANLSKEELALKVKEYVPNFYIHFAAIGSDPDKRNYIVSNERLRKAGFEAKRSLDDGIKELLKGYRMIGRSPFKNI